MQSIAADTPLRTSDVFRSAHRLINQDNTILRTIKLAIE